MVEICKFSFYLFEKTNELYIDLMILSRNIKNFRAGPIKSDIIY